MLLISKHLRGAKFIVAVTVKAVTKIFFIIGKYWKIFLKCVTNTPMRFQLLTDEQKKYLELHHRYEGDKRLSDPIKVVLLKNKPIAKPERIHEETVRQHLTDWASDEKLKLEKSCLWMGQKRS